MTFNIISLCLVVADFRKQGRSDYQQPPDKSVNHPMMLHFYIKHKGICKFHPRTRHESPEGARWRVGGQRHAPAALPPGKRPIWHRTLCGPQGRGGRVRTKSPPANKIRFPDRPAGKESLYGLSYPGLILHFLCLCKWMLCDWRTEILNINRSRMWKQI